MFKYLTRLVHSPIYLTPVDQLYPELFRAMDELRSLGFIVDYEVSESSAGHHLKVSYGNETLRSYSGISEIVNTDTLADLKHIAERKYVMERLEQLILRLALVGWKYQATTDGRISLEKPGSRPRHLSPTYEHLSEIERDLAHAEFLNFIAPYRRKLSEVIEDGCYVADCMKIVITEDLASLGAKIMDRLAGLSFTESDADALRREFEDPYPPYPEEALAPSPISIPDEDAPLIDASVDPPAKGIDQNAV